MESLMAFIAFAYKYASAHAFVVGAAALGYFVKPEMITAFFQKLEDCVNGIKFNLGGIAVDFSKLKWLEDDLNAYLSDHAATILTQLAQLEQGMVNGTLTPDDGQKQVNDLVSGVVEYFMSKAPSILRQYAMDKFGGDKVLAAEFVFRRIFAIVHDLKGEKKTN